MIIFSSFLFHDLCPCFFSLHVPKPVLSYVPTRRVLAQRDCSPRWRRTTRSWSGSWRWRCSTRRQSNRRKSGGRWRWWSRSRVMSRRHNFMHTVSLLKRVQCALTIFSQLSTDIFITFLISISVFSMGLNHFILWGNILWRNAVLSVCGPTFRWNVSLPNLRQKISQARNQRAACDLLRWYIPPKRPIT
jgi:hypothetical protein